MNKTTTGLLTAVLLVTAGCHSATLTNKENNAGPDHPSGAASPSSSPAPAESASSASVKSSYTDLNDKGCGAARTTSEISSERKCPGIEGYKLMILTDDDRDSINIITPDGRQHPLNFSEKISKGAFAALGKKVEWRVATRDGKDVPIALIVRVEVQSGDTNKTTSYLAVAKITERSICVTDRIDPVANANEKARQAADSSANKPCL